MSPIKINSIHKIGGRGYKFLSNPKNSNLLFRQGGKYAEVYKLQDTNNKNNFALKKYKQQYRDLNHAQINHQISEYSKIPGLEICNRYILTKDTDYKFLKDYPDFENSNLSPWLGNSSWQTVLFKRERLNKNQCEKIAKDLLVTMMLMEKGGLAHGDLSASNLLLDNNKIDFNVDSRCVFLADVDQIFHSNFIKPSEKIIPVGTEGYIHPKKLNIITWNEKKDRFSLGIILSEILCWYIDEFREKRYSENSCFDQNEFSKRSDSYKNTKTILLNNYNSEIENLFTTSWFSSTYEICPKASDWFASLDNYFKWGTDILEETSNTIFEKYFNIVNEEGKSIDYNDSITYIPIFLDQNTNSSISHDTPIINDDNFLDQAMEFIENKYDDFILFIEDSYEEFKNSINELYNSFIDFLN